MLADDLVVVGAGKLLAAESVATITARNATVVVVEAAARGSGCTAVGSQTRGLPSTARSTRTCVR